MLTVAKIIEKLDLQAHPEGGYYKETYRSKERVVPPKNFSEELRHWATGIYFLLETGNFSAFHRLKSDETWFFHSGKSISIYILKNNGKLTVEKLGNPLETPDATFQVTIPAEVWFAAEVNEKDSYVLVSCFVAPGFNYVDFELAYCEELTREYPEYTETIRRLTRT